MRVQLLTACTMALPLLNSMNKFSSTSEDGHPRLDRCVNTSKSLVCAIVCNVKSSKVRLSLYLNEAAHHEGGVMAHASASDLDMGELCVSQLHSAALDLGKSLGAH